MQILTNKIYSSRSECIPLSLLHYVHTILKTYFEQDSQCDPLMYFSKLLFRIKNATDFSFSFNMWTVH